MSHLTPEEVVDAIDHELRDDRHEHWRTCAACRARTDQLRQVLHDAKTADVPEPSPLFWPYLAQRVNTAIDLDAAAQTTARPGWLRWTVVTPAAALALVVTALVITVPHPWSPTSSVATEGVARGEGAASPDETLEDGSWRLVVDLVDDMNLDVASHGGLVVTPGLADRALNDLQPDERDELLRLLRAELGPPES